MERDRCIADVAHHPEREMNKRLFATAVTLSDVGHGGEPPPKLVPRRRRS